MLKLLLVILKVFEATAIIFAICLVAFMLGISDRFAVNIMALLLIFVFTFPIVLTTYIGTKILYEKVKKIMLEHIREKMESQLPDAELIESIKHELECMSFIQDDSTLTLVASRFATALQKKYILIKKNQKS